METKELVYKLLTFFDCHKSVGSGHDLVDPFRKQACSSAESAEKKLLLVHLFQNIRGVSDLPFKIARKMRFRGNFPAALPLWLESDYIQIFLLYVESFITHDSYMISP